MKFPYPMGLQIEWRGATLPMDIYSEENCLGQYSELSEEGKLSPLTFDQQRRIFPISFRLGVGKG